MSLNAKLIGTTRNDDGTWTVTVAVDDGEQAADFKFTVDDKRLQQLFRRGVTLELKAKARA